MRNKLTSKQIENVIESAIANEIGKHGLGTEPVVLRLTERVFGNLCKPHPKIKTVNIFHSMYGPFFPIKKTKRACSRIEWANGHVSVFTTI